MIPNKNKIICSEFKKQPPYWKWFGVVVVFLLWFQLLMGATINFVDLESGRHGENDYHVWVYFKDKNDGNIRNEGIYFSRLRESMNHRTIQRRKKVKSLNNLVDEYDIPVSRSYIESVKDSGAKIRTISKWLNAVSVSGSFYQIEMISKHSFVKIIEPVLSGKRREMKLIPQLNKIQSDSSFYGNSFNQLNQINVIQLHESGYTGENVRILVLDSGFYLNHEVFDSLDVIATYDFVDNDSIVSNEEGDQSDQHGHGTSVLSVLAGFKPGTLVGPAYGAEFLLGKTEDLKQENSIEEDWYVLGLEWGESLGAEILSSSIGYIDWYTQVDLNGQTAVITQAVNVAIEKGMVVVTAVGNSGVDGIVAPADAFDVISCGAVDGNGDIANFSSRGPTADNRIKPEICALGMGTFIAKANYTTSYGNGIGTSLATPLVSGVCALLLEAHPDWNPIQVRNSVLNSADRAENPDNTYGWGIVDAFAVLNYEFSDIIPPIVTITFPQNEAIISGLVNIVCEVSDNEGIYKINLWINGDATGILDYSDSYTLEWNTKDYEDSDYNIFVRTFDYEGNFTDSDPITLLVDNSFSISNGYPNPCDKMVSFTLNNPPALKMKLSIMDVKGASSIERNYTLLQNENIVHLNLKDFPTGIYFAIFDFNNHVQITRKICHLRGVENPCTE